MSRREGKIGREERWERARMQPLNKQKGEQKKKNLQERERKKMTEEWQRNDRKSREGKVWAIISDILGVKNVKYASIFFFPISGS